MENKPDIYEISNVINEIQRKHIPDISDDTLFMGMYGYLNEIFSNNIQNSIIMASEWGNEAFPIKAKFEKTVLTNAVTYNVQNLNAAPAKMTVMIGFIKEELEKNMINDQFILDRDCKIMIGDFEYHLDYDIIITKDRLIKNIYSARYNIKRINPLSDITNNLYLTPITLKMNNDDFVFVTCTIRQIENQRIYKKIITNNILENKSFDFHFDKQLANFDVLVQDGKNDVHLTPIFEGMPLNGNNKYCFYNYLDKDTIRVKFDRNSYEPRVNCDITINVQNTRGSDGNFVYKDDILVTLKSNKINYKNLSTLIKPVTSSTNGLNRKTMKELREIIPKEILSRGNITNNKDLENFFNHMVDYKNKLLFFRKRDNQFERLFYAYLLIKDNEENVIPTNTIDLNIKDNQFNFFEDNRYILSPGNIIKYNSSCIGEIKNDIPKNKIYEEEMKHFIYSSPFTIIINKNPLSVSYYLNEINRDYEFRFSYINNSSLQFAATTMHCYKNYLEGNNYKFSTTIVQTMNVDKDLVNTDMNGNILNSNICPILVITVDKYKYYVKGEVKRFNRNVYGYDIEFELETNNIINSDNQIKLNNIYIGRTNTKSYIYTNNKMDISVYILAKFKKEENISPELGEIKNIVPDMNGYTLCNKYTTIEPIELFYNYSNIIRSKVIVRKEDENYIFKIKGSPVVRSSYIDDINRCNNLIDYIQYRKAYIDGALDLIENSFNVDLKFFNTYGPSKTFNIGYVGDILNKVNLTLNFRLKLYIGAEKHTKDHIIYEIKNYIENLNNINNIHMSNLITEISNKFKSEIKFIEFIGINNYDSTYQYLEKQESEILDQIPEFLNINLTKDLKPDINITIV